VGGVSFRDVNSGLKAMRREVAHSCDLYGERHRLIPLVAALDGWRVVEVPVGHSPRRAGRSKYGSNRFLRGLLDLLAVAFLARYDLRPSHFFGGTGVVLGLGGAAILGYLSWLKLETGTLQHRYPLLATGALLVALGFQLVTTGFLAELIVARSRRPRGGAHPVRRSLE
jgi:dolichol-phosphate mannosyltransferase